MLNEQIQEAIKISGYMKATIRDKVTGEIKRVYEYKNLNPTVMKTMIANNLVEETPDNDMAVNYVGIGSGTATPAITDTQLQTEVYRNVISSKTNANNVAYFTAFFDDTEVTGTFREAGLFADATATANSGILVSRVAINITKSSSETLTIDWIITIS